MAETVLIVDDDPGICELLGLYLEAEGYDVVCAYDTGHAWTIVQRQRIDIIILDIQLPDGDGFDLCQELRKITDVPILFLSRKNEEADKVIGLGIGGDDYIEKPFSPREIVARVNAHLRRERFYEKEMEEGQALAFSGLRIVPYYRKVYVNDQPVMLTAKEFGLLYLLASNPQRTFTAEELFQEIWGNAGEGASPTVMVHIGNLRKKIGDDPARPKYIITIRGKGYRFNDKI